MEFLIGRIFLVGFSCFSRWNFPRWNLSVTVISWGEQWLFSWEWLSNGSPPQLDIHCESIVLILYSHCCYIVYSDCRLLSKGNLDVALSLKPFNGLITCERTDIGHWRVIETGHLLPMWYDMNWFYERNKHLLHMLIWDTFFVKATKEIRNKYERKVNHYHIDMRWFFYEKKINKNKQIWEKKLLVSSLSCWYEMNFANKSTEHLWKKKLLVSTCSSLSCWYEINFANKWTEYLWKKNLLFNMFILIMFIWDELCR